MNNKNRIIPNVPKKEREYVEIGYHNVSDWLLYILGIIIIMYLCLTI